MICWYVVSIVVINWLYTVLPVINVPLFGFWPVTSLAVGFVFVLRDLAQNEVGSRNVLWAMAAGATISFYLADPKVAVASALAFIASEVADWAVYTFMNLSMRNRILMSSLISTPVDSFLFLHLIGHFSIGGAVLMTLSKMVGAFFVWKRVPA